MQAIVGEGRARLLRSSLAGSDFLQGGEEALTRANIGQAGASANFDPASAPSPEGTTLKLNLPKRKPSFSIETTGRNAPCPCGSGKKFKNCCGRDDGAV